MRYAAPPPESTPSTRACTGSRCTTYSGNTASELNYRLEFRAVLWHEQTFDERMTKLFFAIMVEGMRA
jgi:hypothetical protein